MATAQMDVVLRHLRRHFDVRGVDELSDGALLQRFAVAREPAAFEALVARHGTMVWGVCRRLLGAEHDAEDAFQATFLVLAKKAGGIREAGAVASWLYGVAHRISLAARENARARDPHAARAAQATGR